MRNTSSDNQEMEESSQYDYEVFLSFRGPDTRTDIADYLYVSMIDAGIGVFRDDEELRPGEEISGQLLLAIEQSKISIPIFSKGYADSAWCLRELVKMVESKKTRGQKIMPLFYDVAPSEVKYQKDHYSSAIVSHRVRFNDETINNWKAALKEVGELMGWDLHGKPNRGKGEFVKEVVNDVLIELKTAYLEVPDYLVDIDRHVDEIMRLIGAHDPKTKIVGIHGIGGMGKTTLAKIVYNQLSKDFSDCCFLSNIRETEITCLQNQLILTILRRQYSDIHNITDGKKVLGQRLCNKKVLLLLDDMDKASQLDALVQKREWFGKGSKIIITTRDRGILNMPSLVDGTYELIDMDFDHSLQLFSKHAFKRDYPLEQYIFHSERAVKICGGLPLALEAIGSLLSRKNIEEWDATLKELEEFPHEVVQRKLMTSIDALNENQRKIFLDVACFFIGYDQRIVIYMWESCKFVPKQSLGVLQQRSLIKIRDDNQLWMHDWLRNIGRNFIQEGSGMKPENQRWVWNYEQALDVLLKMQNGGGVHGMGSIEAICLEFDEQSQHSLIKQFLACLSNLKFLLVNKKSIIPQVDSKDFNEDSVSILTQVDHFQRYRRSNFLQTTLGPLILPELRWLSWNYFPMEYELTNFSLRKLVIIELLRSKITKEWDGWSHIKGARNLKVLNLTGCQELREIPDLSSLMNLERLILEGCSSLAQIDPSISHFKRLVFLNLKDCYHLRRLPEEIGELESLKELLLDSTFVKVLSQWGMAKKRENFSLVEREPLDEFSVASCATALAEHLSVDILFTGLLESFENFNSLTEWNLTCSAIQELPDSNGKMKYLKVLKMPNSFKRKRPSTTYVMEKVEESVVGAHSNLWINICRISVIPRLPQSLIDLCFHSSSTKNGGGFHGNESTKVIRLEFDEQFQYPFFIEFLASLSSLRFIEVDQRFISQVDSKDFEMSIPTQAEPFQYYRTPNFFQTTFGQRILSELRWLSWNYFPMDYELTNFSLKKLVILQLLRSNITEEWDGWSHIKRARNLKVLDLTGCRELRETPDLSFNVNLVQLILKGCRSLVRIHPSISHLNRLVILNLMDCYHLHMLPDELGELESLEELLLDFTSIEEIPEWIKAKKLKILSLVECKSLKKFNFFGCASSSVELSSVNMLFTRLPKSIENFNSLTELDLMCSAIEELPDSIGNMKNLKVLNLRNTLLRKLPSAIRMLEKLERLDVRAYSKLGGEIPDNIGKLKFLRKLWINIHRISVAQQLPESLINLCFHSSSTKVLPDLSNLLNLRQLFLLCPRITTLSADIICLSQLKVLSLVCRNLQCLPRLPTNLLDLYIAESKRLKTTNDLSDLKSLGRLRVQNCCSLTEIQGLEGLEDLRELELKRLPSLAKLPRLTNLKELKEIRLEDCPEFLSFSVV